MIDEKLRTLSISRFFRHAMKMFMSFRSWMRSVPSVVMYLIGQLHIASKIAGDAIQVQIIRLDL